MKIQKITRQNRRDFTAVYECEHCGATETGYGYDDDNFHCNVIPYMKCKQCGKTAQWGRSTQRMRLCKADWGEQKEIHEALQNGETVTLDFEGMSQFVLYLLEQRS